MTQDNNKKKVFTSVDPSKHTSSDDNKREKKAFYKTRSRSPHRNADSNEPQFAKELIKIRRVSKVTSGTKRLSFSAFMIVGDKAGKIGLGMGKGKEVQTAIRKAEAVAKRNMIKILMRKDIKTVTHQIRAKYKAAIVLIKPGIKGSGVVAGGAVRKVLEIAGLENVVAKSIGSSNSIANAKCTVLALSKLLK